MLRLRSRVVQLSSEQLTWSCRGRVCPSRVGVAAAAPALVNQRRYAAADNADYKPIKKLLVANRGSLQ